MAVRDEETGCSLSSRQVFPGHGRRPLQSGTKCPCGRQRSCYPVRPQGDSGATVVQPGWKVWKLCSLWTVCGQLHREDGLSFPPDTRWTPISHNSKSRVYPEHSEGPPSSYGCVACIILFVRDEVNFLVPGSDPREFYK